MNKNLIIPLSIVIVGVFIGGAVLLTGNSQNNSLDANTAQGNLRKVDLEIQNMFCIGCRSSVANSVRAIPGVVQADADPGTDSGWVIYDPSEITKEQILAASIFKAYPARILSDEVYRGDTTEGQIQEIPPEIEQKLNELAQRLQNRGIELEPFFQEELDDAINRGYWDKANNLLDNYLESIYE